MKKRNVVLSLGLACALTLSGCSLVVKDAKVDAARTILSVNGETRDKKTFTADYTAALEQQKRLEQIYKSYGISAPSLSDEDVLKQVMDSAVRSLVLEQKAKALRFDELSAEEQKKLEENAENAYQNELNAVKAQYFAGTTLEKDALDEAVKQQAEKLGVTKDLVTESARRAIVLEKLRAEAVKDVTVTAEEIKAEFDKRADKDKERFEKDKDAYGKAVLNGETVYFAPAGYRYVKQVLIKFTDDSQKAIDEARAALSPLTAALSQAQAAYDAAAEAVKAEGLADDKLQELNDKKAEADKALTEARDKAAAAQKNVDDALAAGYAAIENKANEVYEKAKAGEDFDKLIEEYNQDPGMTSDGYAVCENFSAFDAAFVSPAMALENKGDVAAPSKGLYGFYIVSYAGDVTEGPVDLALVQDTIEGELKTARQNDVYEETVANWVKESDVETHPEYMKD